MALLLEFSQLNLRRMVRMPFFPSFFVRKDTLDFETLKEAVSSHHTRYKIERKGKAFKVSASTFSGLNEIADAIFKETGFRALVLEPERQFLLERQWSYFDCFTFFSEKEFVKSQSVQFPEAKVELFSEPLNETIEQLLAGNQELAGKILESISLSNLLKKPITDLPESLFAQMETLLENDFWEEGLSIRVGSFSGNEEPCSKALPECKGLSEVDFSMLWPTLLTKTFYNLGIDSMDCECCKPSSASERNVLPSSEIEVEMQQDAFFFESNSVIFAKHFHSTTPGKASRLRRMNEFCLQTIPLGPFFRNQRAVLPLIDAVKLQHAKKAKISAAKKLHWFCLEKESLASKLVCSLQEEIALLENGCERANSNAVKENGILGPAMLAKSPGFLLKKSRQSISSELLSSIPSHLCEEKSAFFSKDMAFAIEAIEALVLHNFKSFAKGKESRVVASNGSKAFLKSDRPYSLIKQFSQKQRVPSLISAKSN